MSIIERCLPYRVKEDHLRTIGTISSVRFGEMTIRHINNNNIFKKKHHSTGYKFNNDDDTTTTTTNNNNNNDN